MARWGWVGVVFLLGCGASSEAPAPDPPPPPASQPALEEEAPGDAEDEAPEDPSPDPQPPPQPVYDGTDYRSCETPADCDGQPCVVSALGDVGCIGESCCAQDECFNGCRDDSDCPACRPRCDNGSCRNPNQAF